MASRKNTRRYIKKNKRVGRSVKSTRVSVYKIVTRTLYGGIMSPVLWKPINRGWFYSNRHKKKLNLKDDRVLPPVLRLIDDNFMVIRGIHVFLNMKAALGFASINENILKCTALLSDLIGVDKEQEHGVFNRIFIPKKEYAKG